MAIDLDKLKELHHTASPPPWFDEDGDVFKRRPDGGYHELIEYGDFYSADDGALVAATRNALGALIEVAEAALEYVRLAPFPVYTDLPSEHAGRRLEHALAPFKEPT